MNGSDRSKLVKAGIRVMRAENINKTITELNAKGHWNLVERCQTISELQKFVKKLREDEKTIFEFD